MRQIFPFLTCLPLSCGAALAAPLPGPHAPIVPAKFPAPPTFSLSSARPDNMGAWNFYSSASGETTVLNYTPLKPTEMGPNVMVSPTPQLTLPHLFWPANDSTGVITVRPESDRNAANHQGDLIAMWTVPATDLYLVKLGVENIGLDVKGGDGGVLTISHLSAEANTDTQVVDRVVVPASDAKVPQGQSYTLIDARAGDRIVLRLNAGADGYADQWKLHYVIARTGPEGYLAQPPVVPLPPAPALRPGLFFLGTSADWANGPFALESLQLFRKFVPNLGAVLVSHQPERILPLDFYRNNNIPTLIQSWGPVYMPYLQAKDAVEINWKGIDLSKPGLPLSGTAHALAMPHPASREAFERVTRSSVRSGYSGFGFQDMVWMWGGGRGATGYNPATIKAFRQDLRGMDGGLQLMPLSGKPTDFKFADYARYYLGGMPTPADFGVSNWAQYQPITFEEYSKKLKGDYTRDFLLFDMLVHYEWLKMADFLGQTARSENGAFQVMPNPEDVANGSDFLLAGQLSNVSLLSEEYFAGPEFLDGAYFHNPYYGRLAAKNRSSMGVVMESGGGGNDIPYYDNGVAYAAALELSLATKADHMEGDFWPSRWASLQEAIKDPVLLARYQQLLAFGLGFTDAKKDGLRRLQPDFISVTSRRIFRPWDGGANRWAWTTSYRLSPENSLAQSGFNFLGIGEEGLSSLKQPQKVVSFAGAPPTENGWQRFIQMISQGQIERGIAVAGALQEVVTKKFEMKPFISRFPQWKFQVRDVSPYGALRMGGSRVGTASYSVVGAIYADQKPGSSTVLTLGDQPLVVKRTVGKGTLFVLLFDPSLRDNKALTAAVYEALLKPLGIQKRWQSDNGSISRLYQNGELTAVGVQHPKLRTPGPAGPDYLAKRAWPYKMDGELEVKVRLKPGQTYNWVALPSGEHGQSKANQSGFVQLRHRGTSCEVFYLLPSKDSNKAKLQSILARRETFNRAMTMDGLAPLSPPPPAK